MASFLNTGFPRTTALLKIVQRVATTFIYLFARLRYPLPVDTRVNDVAETYRTASPTHRTPDFLAPRGTVAVDVPHRDIASARARIFYKRRSSELKSAPAGAPNASQGCPIPLETSRYQQVVVVWRYTAFRSLLSFHRHGLSLLFSLRLYTCAPVQGLSHYFLCHIPRGIHQRLCLLFRSRRPRFDNGPYSRYTT